MDGLFGRHELMTAVDEITKDNVREVLEEVLPVHAVNAMQINYLYQYMKGNQPILGRTKDIRPEICNKVVENHAMEIAQFTSGYFLGEPVTYIRRGERAGASEDVALLNDYMFSEDKSSHDKDMATWMAVCGVGYRMVLPHQDDSDCDDEAPFQIDTPDPRTTFVVYNTGFGHKRMMGVRDILRREGVTDVHVYCGYTKTHYFEYKGGILQVWKPHMLGEIPIFEYRLNMARTGSFEPALPLLDQLNNIESNRVDGIEQFVQSFLKFVNCDVDEEDVESLKEMGAIKIKSTEGLPADVELISQELSQNETQTLVDYIYDQILCICGLPTTTKGGTSTSDTGQAVILRDGWTQCEVRAKDTETLFKRSEKQFLKLVLKIIQDTQGFDLKLSEVECKFTRRQHDNLLSKTQALLNLLNAGIEPTEAIATVGISNDPGDVAMKSAEYLEKWLPAAEEAEEIEVERTTANPAADVPTTSEDMLGEE